jgi:hypothetical protein
MNCCVAPAATLAVAGDTASAVSVLALLGGGAVLDPHPALTIIAPSETMQTRARNQLQRNPPGFAGENLKTTHDIKRHTLNRASWPQEGLGKSFLSVMDRILRQAQTHPSAEKTDSRSKY